MISLPLKTGIAAAKIFRRDRLFGEADSKKLVRSEEKSKNEQEEQPIVNDLNKFTSTLCHCERSEAISWDCHVALLLAMTTFRSRSL